MEELSLENVKSVWFDFGRVLLPLDVDKTYSEFKLLGANADLKQNVSLFNSWERGEITRHEFYQSLKKQLSGFASVPSIRAAWNAMLLELPRHHFKLVQKIKSDFELFLVSNTNSVHIEAIRQNMGIFRYNQFLNCFDEVFYSYEMGVRKPEQEFFDRILGQSQYAPEECLFIDDDLDNIRAAEERGIQTWHFNPDKHELDMLTQKMAL